MVKPDKQETIENIAFKLTAFGTFKLKPKKHFSITYRAFHYFNIILYSIIPTQYMINHHVIHRCYMNISIG